LSGLSGKNEILPIISRLSRQWDAVGMLQNHPSVNKNRNREGAIAGKVFKKNDWQKKPCG
jgi:hypothetical protein